MSSRQKISGTSPIEQTSTVTVDNQPQPGGFGTHPRPHTTPSGSDAKYRKAFNDAILIRKYRPVGDQINKLASPSGVHRPEFLRIPQLPEGFLIVREKIDEFINKVQQLLNRVGPERWPAWRLEYELAALWEDHIWQHIEAKKGNWGAREGRLNALRDLGQRLEQNHNAQITAAWSTQLRQRHAQETQAWEQDLARQRANVFLFDAAQTRATATNTSNCR